MNAVEKLRLNYVIEDVNGNPKLGDTTELMRKELKKMKVIENRNEKERKYFLLCMEY